MPLRMQPTALADVVLLDSERIDDERGSFLETFKASTLRQFGIDLAIAQVNESVSHRGVLRGLHYQLTPAAQGKLVRVLRGKVLDVAVDVRQGSPTFAQHVAVQLSAEEANLLWVPPGFAHGFCTLTDDTHFLYMQSAEYAPELEAGIHAMDETLGIEWPLPASELILSGKDRQLPRLSEARNNFQYAGVTDG